MKYKINLQEYSYNIYTLVDFFSSQLLKYFRIPIFKNFYKINYFQISSFSITKQ